MTAWYDLCGKQGFLQGTPVKRSAALEAVGLDAQLSEAVLDHLVKSLSTFGNAELKKGALFLLAAVADTAGPTPYRVPNKRGKEDTSKDLNTPGPDGKTIRGCVEDNYLPPEGLPARLSLIVRQWKIPCGRCRAGYREWATRRGCTIVVTGDEASDSVPEGATLIFTRNGGECWWK